MFNLLGVTTDILRLESDPCHFCGDVADILRTKFTTCF